MAVAVASISSSARKASGNRLRRLAESSRLRSSAALAALPHATAGRAATSRASEQIFSALTGLRLKGMALLPTCCSPNGSATSPRACSSRRSKANLCRLAASPASAESAA
ncbi:MAG: hypothetical protein HY784_00870 [Chloroflexi bacterium]|nr:hypothetical protein [Chloroflexota bacterium]